MNIGNILDTFLRTTVATSDFSKSDTMKKVKAELKKIINGVYKKKEHQIFIEAYVVENDFYALIGIRPLTSQKFGFINCKIRLETNEQT